MRLLCLPGMGDLRCIGSGEFVARPRFVGAGVLNCVWALNCVWVLFGWSVRNQVKSPAPTKRGGLQTSIYGSNFAV